MPPRRRATTTTTATALRRAQVRGAQNRSPQWRGVPVQSTHGPVLGEVRVHRKTGLMYIYDFIPGKEKVAWIRFDTWFWGAWSQFPHRTADARDLRRFPRKALHLGNNNTNEHPRPTFVRVELE